MKFIVDIAYVDYIVSIYGMLLLRKETEKLWEETREATS